MTPNETKLLAEIAGSDFADAREGEWIPTATLTQHFEAQSLGGVLSGLVQKGLIEWDGGEVALTDAGLHLAND